MTREWYLRNVRKPFIVLNDAYISNISIGDKITIYEYEIISEDNDGTFEISQIECTIKSIKEIDKYQEKDSHDALVYDVELSVEDNKTFWSSELVKITKEDKRISYYLTDNEKQRSNFLNLKLPEIIDKVCYRFTTDSYEIMGVNENYKVDIPLPAKFKSIIDEFTDAGYDFIQWSGTSLKFSNIYSSNEVSIYMNLYKNGLIPKEDIELQVNIKKPYLKYKEVELFQKLLDYHATEECQEFLRKVLKDYNLKCFRKTQDKFNALEDMKIKQKAWVKLETAEGVEDYQLLVKKISNDKEPLFEVLEARPNDAGGKFLIGTKLVSKWNKVIEVLEYKDEDNLSYIFLFRLKHQYGKVKFVDKNDTVIQTIDVDKIAGVSVDFYSEIVEYNELLPTDNPYKDEIVACIKFKDRTKEELYKR